MDYRVDSIVNLVSKFCQSSIYFTVYRGGPIV